MAPNKKNKRHVIIFYLDKLEKYAQDVDNRNSNGKKYKHRREVPHWPQGHIGADQAHDQGRSRHPHWIKHLLFPVDIDRRPLQDQRPDELEVEEY